MLTFQTAGESHGPALTVVVAGLPAGLDFAPESVEVELRRRQLGFGRGGRMKIEQDSIRVLSGVRHGKTLGSPVAMLIENRDWANWQEVMSATPVDPEVELRRRVTRPRPGHTDLAGSLKFNHRDARNVLERSSARETPARVAAGALARIYLSRFGVGILSHTTAIGSVRLNETTVTWDRIAAVRMDDVVRCVDPDTATLMVEEIRSAQKDGDTVGGTFEVVARGVPAGIGSHVSWDARLDGMLGQAFMSIHAVKAIEVGSGVSNAFQRGSRVHDEIAYDSGERRFHRLSNRAGGIEGGISNGEEIRVTGFLKPIPTLGRSLRSVDMISKEPFLAQHERSDACTVPAAGVIGEAMMALVLARAFAEKFGGDSIGETERNYNGYIEQLRTF